MTAVVRHKDCLSYHTNLFHSTPPGGGVDSKGEKSVCHLDIFIIYYDNTYM